MPDLLLTIGGVPITRRGAAITWLAGLAIDADGAPDAYHPVSANGRDRLANAGEPGNWYGLVCDVSGQPIIQGPHDPRPGFYVSPTALADRSKPLGDPRRYVDSNQVPYLAMPPELRELGLHLGDLALVEYRAQWSPAIFADVGPRRKIGEGSIALARALGLPEDPRHGGTGAGVRVTAWPGSAFALRWPALPDAIAARVAGLRAQLSV